MNMKVDLFLDGDLGLWVLDQIKKEQVGCVFTTDSDLFSLACKKDLTALLDDPNSLQYSPSRCAISVHYKKILNKSVLKKYQGAYNLHPGYLPWGRGYYPIFWALWENTPAGATLHEMSEQVDQGSIVEQVQIAYGAYETGYDVFLRVRDAEKKLFLKYFPKIATGDFIPSCAQVGKGSYHTRKDFLSLKEKIEWESLSADLFIKLVRYLTFPGYSGFSVELEGKCYEILLNSIENS